MKAIICFHEGGIHIGTFTESWTSCVCGNVRVKWLDPDTGTVIVAAKHRDSVRILGLHNTYLINAIQGGLGWRSLQSLHSEATKSPGYVFDEDKAGCWAVVLKIGGTQDVRWADEDEYREAFDLGIHLDVRLDESAPH